MNNLVGDIILRLTIRILFRYIKSQEKDAQRIPIEKEKMEVVLLNRNPRKRGKSERNHVPLLDRSVHFMKEIVVTRERVTKLLKELKPSKAL